MSSLRLLFVCTGNTCRSPLAEVLARAEAERRGLSGVECRSAGTFALPGEPASELAETVARRHGLDLGEHRSTPLVPALVEWADRVFGMGRSHVDIARELSPGSDVELITRYLPEGDDRHGGPVVDPVGGTLGSYEETFRTLERAVAGILDRVERELRPDGPVDGASLEE